VRWRVILLEYRFIIEHIPGEQNIVADGLTKVNTLVFNQLDKCKRHLYRNDSISRIFRLGGEGIEETEFPAEVNEEGESGGKEDLDEYRIMNQRREVMARYHNSIVGAHFEVHVIRRSCLGWDEPKR
jgi:hypothetical protein